VFSNPGIPPSLQPGTPRIVPLIQVFLRKYTVNPNTPSSVKLNLGILPNHAASYRPVAKREWLLNYRYSSKSVQLIQVFFQRCSIKTDIPPRVCQLKRVFFGVQLIQVSPTYSVFASAHPVSTHRRRKKMEEVRERPDADVDRDHSPER